MQTMNENSYIITITHGKKKKKKFINQKHNPAAISKLTEL